MRGFGDSLCTVGLVIIVIILVIIIIRRITGRRSSSADTPQRPSIGGTRPPDGPHRPTYDRPDIKSGASIGGGPRVEEEPEPREAAAMVGPLDSDWSATEVSYQDEDAQSSTTEARTLPSRAEKKPGGRVDSPDIKSGGSFGG
jgi:hypothetical protein